MVVVGWGGWGVVVVVGWLQKVNESLAGRQARLAGWQQ